MESEQEFLPSPPGPLKELPPVPARSSVPKLPDTTSNNKEAHFDEVELEADDEVSQQMTASYSEISFRSDLSPTEPDLSLSLTIDPLPLTEEILQRPVTLPCTSNLQSFRPLNLDGSVHIQGNMTHFVVEDLEYKIKLSSPVNNKRDTLLLATNSKSATPNSLYRQLLIPQVGVFDAGLLSDLESEAQHMATSIDNLTENLCGILHSISSITADNVDIYKDAVSKMSDSMDGNIKSMYTVMAKAEEVTEAMKGVQVHATRIKEIKRLVDLFESCA